MEKRIEGASGGKQKVNEGRKGIIPPPKQPSAKGRKLVGSKQSEDKPSNLRRSWICNVELNLPV